MNELKPPKTFQEQLALLETRDMVVDDSEKALRALQQMNYYRLTGYAYQYKHAKGERYQAGTTFEQVIQLYSFDQEFRRILYKYLELIEIYARTQVAYHFSHLYGSAGHYDNHNFEKKEYHEKFLISLSDQMGKNKDSAFVAHHIRKYGGSMPVWVAVEILSFSSLSKFFSNVKKEGKEYIAAQIGFDAYYLTNWLHCFSVLRNTCAHYGRIYNNLMRPSIKLGGKTLRSYPQIKNDSIFAYMVAMLRFLPCKKDEFVNDVVDVVEKWSASLDLGLLGFPQNWKELLFDKELIDPITKKPKEKTIAVNGKRR